ncbi:MAG TPA: hypothetical protein PLP02_02340 [Bacillota bacterium]|nr:hypothetical protein [Bacillota bacterium]
MNNEKNLINISKKSFLSVIIILFVLMVAAGILTKVIPAGEYARDAEGAIISDDFHYLTENVGLAFWKWALAPFLVFGSSDGLTIAMISLFLLILGGAFSVMDKTGGIRVIIDKLINRFKERKYTLMRLIILVFMVFGAFFGIFEESVALLPIIILLSLSLGWDTMVGIGMCLLAAGFGFASGITNPFSVGIASQIAGVNLLDGVLYRLLIFGVMYLMLSTFLVSYAKKIEKDPSRSPSFAIDSQKSKDFGELEEIPYKNKSLILKSYVIMFFSVLLVVIISSLLDLFAGLSIPTIPLMALAFLIGGLLSGYLITRDFRKTLAYFLKGALSVAPAVLLIMMAASIKYIITTGCVMDTILYKLSGLLSGQSPVVAILMIYGLVLSVQFFIGSASAKAYLIMPLLVPLVSIIGISKELSILAFIFGDGYTNVIFPTNAVLLIGLSIASVNYTTWLKFTWKLQVATLLLTITLLIVGYYIGY